MKDKYLWIHKSLSAMLMLALFLSVATVSVSIASASPTVLQESAEPTAMDIIKEATDFLKDLKQFSFVCEMVEDTSFEDGQQVKSAHEMAYYVKRPDKLRFRTEGDMRNREWFYNGKTITAQDLSRNLYSQESFPPTIDAALEKARDDLNLRLSITSVAKNDFYELLTSELKSATVVGMSRVMGIECYQLLLERDQVNVQLWVDAGKHPLFRKVVITYKDEESMPEWSAVFTKWDLSPRLADSFFEFKPPKGSVKIEFLRPLKK